MLHFELEFKVWTNRGLRWMSEPQISADYVDYADYYKELPILKSVKSAKSA